MQKRVYFSHWLFSTFHNCKDGRRSRGPKCKRQQVQTCLYLNCWYACLISNPNTKQKNYRGCGSLTCKENKLCLECEVWFVGCLYLICAILEDTGDLFIQMIRSPAAVTSSVIANQYQVSIHFSTRYLYIPVPGIYTFQENLALW